MPSCVRAGARAHALTPARPHTRACVPIFRVNYQITDKSMTYPRKIPRKLPGSTQITKSSKHSTPARPPALSIRLPLADPAPVTLSIRLPLAFYPVAPTTRPISGPYRPFQPLPYPPLTHPAFCLPARSWRADVLPGKSPASPPARPLVRARPAWRLPSSPRQMRHY